MQGPRPFGGAPWFLMVPLRACGLADPGTAFPPSLLRVSRGAVEVEYCAIIQGLMLHVRKAKRPAEPRWGSVQRACSFVPEGRLLLRQITDLNVARS